MAELWHERHLCDNKPDLRLRHACLSKFGDFPANNFYFPFDELCWYYLGLYSLFQVHLDGSLLTGSWLTRMIISSLLLAFFLCLTLSDCIYEHYLNRYIFRYQLHLAAILAAFENFLIQQLVFKGITNYSTLSFVGWHLMAQPTNAVCQPLECLVFHVSILNVKKILLQHLSDCII